MTPSNSDLFVFNISKKINQYILLKLDGRLHIVLTPMLPQLLLLSYRKLSICNVFNLHVLRV